MPIETPSASAESRFRSLLDSVASLVVILSSDGRIVDASRSVFEPTGLPREHLLGRAFVDMPWWAHSAEERAHLFAAIEAARSGRTTTYEAVLVRIGNGERMDLELTVAPLSGTSGDALEIVVSGTDLTARKGAERRLEETISLLRTTLDSTADGILAVDLRGNPTSWNERMLSIWGLPPEIVEKRDGGAILGFAAGRVVDPPDFAEKAAELYQRPQDEAREVLRLVDGRILHRYSRPQRRGDEVIGRVCSYRDVTELTRLLRTAEEARAEAERSRRVMANLLEQISDGFVALDNDWKYVFANTSGARMLGRTPETLIGRHIWTEFPEGKGKPFDVAYSKAVVEQEMLRIRDYYEPWGRWFENRIYPSADGLAILYTDVTAEEEAAARLRVSAEELRSLAARLDGVREEERRLLARELHDRVGQALTALRLDLACLARVAPLGEGPAKEHSDRMAGLLERTIALVRRLSAELHSAELDDLGLPTAIAAHLQELETRSGLRTRFSVQNGEPKLTPPKALAIFRIFQEAVANVVRHAGARRVDVRLSTAADRVELTVEDDGRGIRPEDRGRSSLGLVGMRERALVVGGTVEVTGEAGKGTRVRASVPLSEPASLPSS